MIDADRLQKALTFLATTDVPAAEAKAAVETCENARKRALALAYLAADGQVKERESKAQVSDAVQSAENAKVDAVLTYEKLKNKRETEERIIETWRSINSNRRAGVIT